jgi:hypothetical protein
MADELALQVQELQQKARDFRSMAAHIESQIARLEVAEGLNTRNQTVLVAVTFREYDEYGDIVMKGDAVESSRYQIRIVDSDYDRDGELLQGDQVIHGFSDKVGEGLEEMLLEGIKKGSP